jgi:hypothetical protein
MACVVLYDAFFDVDSAVINEGGGTETQRATQVDTQTTLIDIKDELASQATGWSRRTGGYTELEDVCLCESVD